MTKSLGAIWALSIKGKPTEKILPHVCQKTHMAALPLMLPIAIKPQS
jgi:hypothetical protein